MAEKKKKAKKSVKKKNSGEVCEVFEVSKNGKEKEIITCSDVPDKQTSKKELTRENTTLRNVLIGIFIFALIFIVTALMIRQSSIIEYEGVQFEKIDYSGLPFYHTTFPIVYQGKDTIYNEYLRLNPKVTAKNVPFEGDLNVRAEMVFHSEDQFNCDGDGIIAVANLRDLYQIAGINVVVNDSYGCDEYGRYMYVNLLAGNDTKIVQTGTSCYNLYVSNCEVLDVTERFMIETLVKINEQE